LILLYINKFIEIVFSNLIQDMAILHALPATQKIQFMHQNICLSVYIHRRTLKLVYAWVNTFIINHVYHQSLIFHIHSLWIIVRKYILTIIKINVRYRCKYRCKITQQTFLSLKVLQILANFIEFMVLPFTFNLCTVFKLHSVSRK